jgi:hypothetical protein
MSNGEFKIFKRFNAVDIACLATIAFCLIGFMLAKEGHAGVNTQIRGTHKVDICIYFGAVKTKDNDLFKVGDPAALTIRNVPINPPLTITAVKHTPKMAAFLSPDGKKAVAYPDVALPIARDFEVTISGMADVTDDGFVVRGNKLKVGNQVDLEGFKYRLPGVVCDIGPSAEAHTTKQNP